MPKHGEKLIQRTQKGLSALAFETSKQSRILKRRMRIFALQKEVKADLQDLGSIVFTAMQRRNSGVLEEEEVRILAGKIAEATHEIDRLRDAISRISRVHKVVIEEMEELEETSASPMSEAGAQEEVPKGKEGKGKGKKSKKRKRIALRHMPKRLSTGGKGGEGVDPGAKTAKDAKEDKETK